ncbi:MAG: DUF1153 domain-containing protein [Alphaproteobacteria bacterium]|nr:DUF1153 domain-containing protein [Alphaproteobacteria bacterium]MBU0796511.1 DUF1153 domain-containing protein [Alphaproteobacteria bacterium]MBU0888075.1 DUF1153 domain-containing protein [Alphaproteobacteria bacterium]MBU1811520.1 DUF1153 domain-containing protein [Alphaproteobacteria bacterium]MBU2090333.1 DUF1153 domain-containing protein [Alphaproteobacteria bacterium]
MRSRSLALQADRPSSSSADLVASNDDALTLDDLPPPETERWVIRRKALVVAGVDAGLLTAEEACQRYRLSMEELSNWRRLIEKHGVKGLRATRIQRYRVRD